MGKKRLAVFISGRGSNFRAIAEQVKKGNINGDIVLVISDNSNANGLQYARENNFPTEVFEYNKDTDRDEYFKSIMDLIKSKKIDLIILAGFMRVLSPNIVNEYSNRIINIHPALLPSFPGTHAQKQALDYGVKMSGCTVHFVDNGVDTGPIIKQVAVDVKYDDTEDSLSDRILEKEHTIFPEAVKLFCENRLMVSGRRVEIK